MKILYIGAGFVGACSAAISADSGHDVLVYDIDKAKIKALGSQNMEEIENCLFEKGLGDILIRNKQRIKFTSDYEEVEKFFDEMNAVFMCLPTPEIGETGESDLSYYFDAINKMAGKLVARNQGRQTNYFIIINKSTVPVEMVLKTKEILSSYGVINFGVVSNPEFLVEGKAIEGSLKPDRIVVGAESEKDFEIARKIYQRFYDSPSVYYIEVNPKEAAAGKLLANFCLFNKLMVCFDVVGRTCESFEGIKFENIRKILSTDARIGEWGFYDSLYAGGSCFIKDSRSLSFQLKNVGKNTVFIDEVYSANKRQLNLLLDRAEIEAGVDWKGKNVVIFGLAFKRDTNDIRNSPSLLIVQKLLDKEVGKIVLFDPAAVDNFKKVFPATEKITYAESDEKAFENGADVVIIATDWSQFRGLSKYLLQQTSKPIIIDGRRMLQHEYENLVKSGYKIIAVGSPFIM